MRSPTPEKNVLIILPFQLFIVIIVIFLGIWIIRFWSSFVTVLIALITSVTVFIYTPALCWSLLGFQSNKIRALKLRLNAMIFSLDCISGSVNPPNLKAIVHLFRAFSSIPETSLKCLFWSSPKSNDSKENVLYRIHHFHGKKPIFWWGFVYGHRDLSAIVLKTEADFLFWPFKFLFPNLIGWQLCI